MNKNYQKFCIAHENKVVQRYTIIPTFFIEINLDIIKRNETLLSNISGDFLNRETYEVIQNNYNLLSNLNQFIFSLLNFINNCLKNLKIDTNIDRIPSRMIEAVTLIYLIIKNYKTFIFQHLIDIEDRKDSIMDYEIELKRIYDSNEYMKIKNSSYIFDEITYKINAIYTKAIFNCEYLLKLFYEQKGFCLINFQGFVLFLDHYAQNMLNNSCSIGTNLLDVLTEKSRKIFLFMKKKLTISKTPLASYLCIIKKKITDLSLSTNEMATSSSLAIDKYDSILTEDIFQLNNLRTLEVRFSLIFSETINELDLAIMLEMKNSKLTLIF